VVQTHASYVFLAGSIVYKVKKPVSFGFLDFSTLARRRRFCLREVALNRHLAPDVYVDVVPICGAGRAFSLNGDGAVVEYAVRMRRLSDRGFASKRLRRGRFGPRAVDRVAAKLGRFYRAQMAAAERRLPDRQRLSIDDNLRLIRRHATGASTRAAVAALSAFTHAFYAEHDALLRRRRSEGRVLDCHGDLRLEHVHIEGAKIRIYDCIEFNDRLRTIDVANDVAFLAMDLDYEGRPDLARQLVRAIGRATGDRDLAKLVEFYKCYRAAVRNKVECLRVVESDARETERVASAERAARYLALALHYATLGSRPAIVVVMGEVACGKSTLARGIAEALGVSVASSDVIRKRLAKLPLHRRPSGKRREVLYAKGMSRRVYTALLAAARRAVTIEHSIVLDATFARRADRDRLRALAGRFGASVQFIELLTPPALRRRRLAERARVAGSVSDARLEDFDALAKRYEPPLEIVSGPLSRVRSRKTARETLASALVALARRRGRDL